jgi:Ca-activated chloride channel family protein
VPNVSAAQNHSAAQKNESVGASEEWQAMLGQSFLTLWFTPDQQGRYYFAQGDYARATQYFTDPAWKGMAFYYNENFSAAAELFAQLETSDGLFNLANAQAQGQHYVLAVKTYNRVLALKPKHLGARQNRQRIQQIIDEINLLSESQQPEAGEAIAELGDAPQRADGAQKADTVPKPMKQLTAQDILTDERVHNMWMRQIQQDPSRFLRVKFQMQLNQASKP